MGQVLHGCARTTEAVRRAIQDSQASLNVLATRYGINPKTVAKWRQRQNVQDLPMGPKLVRSSVLTPEEEAAIVAFRRYTLLDEWTGGAYESNHQRRHCKTLLLPDT